MLCEKCDTGYEECSPSLEEHYLFLRPNSFKKINRFRNDNNILIFLQTRQGELLLWILLGQGMLAKVVVSCRYQSLP